jgi:diphosphomevalonate decarboxylase
MFTLQVTSTTNFPIEAGLASSAAGYAAMAYAFGQMFSLQQQNVCMLARFGKIVFVILIFNLFYVGSGSACRSLDAGFVHWHAGQLNDGSDCVCEVLI